MKTFLTKNSLFFFAMLIVLPCFSQDEYDLTTNTGKQISINEIKSSPVKIKSRNENYGIPNYSIVYTPQIFTCLKHQTLYTIKVPQPLKYAVWSKGTFF